MVDHIIFAVTSADAFADCTSRTGVLPPVTAVLHHAEVLSFTYSNDYLTIPRRYMINLSAPACLA